MRNVIIVLIWTLSFVVFGIYSEKKINDFTDKFKYEIELIQENIENDKFEDAISDVKDWSKLWHEEKNTWYKIVNEEYFDDICLSINILEESIKYNDKLNALEEIENIKMYLNNILDAEKFDLNHIF